MSGDEGKKIRTYLDDVPEDIKEQLSKEWGERKKETYAAADKHGIKIEVGQSFNKVVVMELEAGYYHFVSGIASASDISPEHSDIGDLCSNLINGMVRREREIGCVPIAASNVCDWDSNYAKSVGANVHLRNAVIGDCIENAVILTGGETANLGDQVRKTGMSWMFTLLSRYDGPTPERLIKLSREMDAELQETFGCIADRTNYGMVEINGEPMIHLKKRGKFILTADGTGSKSIVCDQVEQWTDSECTLAMCCDDASREGAFPIAASLGVHAETNRGKEQIIKNMIDSGRKHLIPIVGSVFHQSPDVYTYTMNGVVLSEVREESAQVGKIIKPGTGLVLLYEMQRSNGITMQRRIPSEVFGENWYKMTVADAFRQLNDKLGGKYEDLPLIGDDRTLGELVAQPSTPYFRVDSKMPRHVLETVKFRINVSSGGLIGKTRRLLEPKGLGAFYFNTFNAPVLILILQMASELQSRENPEKGIVTDLSAYYTWGCGIGAVIGTTAPDTVKGYYDANGVRARVGGVVVNSPEICVVSKCLESTQHEKPHVLRHPYTDKPLA